MCLFDFASEIQPLALRVAPVWTPLGPLEHPQPPSRRRGLGCCGWSTFPLPEAILNKPRAPGLKIPSSGLWESYPGYFRCLVFRAGVPVHHHGREGITRVPIHRTGPQCQAAVMINVWEAGRSWESQTPLFWLQNEWLQKGKRGPWGHSMVSDKSPASQSQAQLSRSGTLGGRPEVGF